MKFRLQIIFAVLCAVFILQGCTTNTRVFVMRTLRKHGMEKQMKLRHPETGREIVMIGMMHVEEPEFFEEIKQYLDSVKREGYVVFYEGLSEGDVDSARLDTAFRKFRRVVGVDLSYDYDKLSSSDKYVMQTLDILGLTTDRDFNVDLTYNEMIAEYERRYVEIILTDYDWQTDLDEKYRRRKAGKQKHSLYSMLNTIREEFIVEEVFNSAHPKIVLLYGVSHWFPLYAPFEDAGYEVVEGKPFPSFKPDKEI